MRRAKLRMHDCVDCELGTRREYYMVHDAIWRAAGRPRGMLCIGCLEQRLGRELIPADFTDAPVNKPSPWNSKRLRQRKGLPPYYERKRKERAL